jgi:hypothetical protein
MMVRMSRRYLAWLSLGLVAAAACGNDDETSASNGGAGGSAVGGSGGTAGSAGWFPAGAGGSSGAGGASGQGGVSGEAGQAGSGGIAGSAGAGGNPTCPATCEPVSGAPSPYGSLPTVGEKTDRPPPEHADLNPKLRGWASCLSVSCGTTGGTFGLIQIDPGPGGLDTKAPRLHTLFDPDRLAGFAENYRGYDWDWGCTSGPHGCRGDLIDQWDVHFVGMATAPGEELRLPHSGYDIGQGYQARVLYADGDTITLKYTGEDNVVMGYTLHIVGVCLEPGLRAKYDADDQAGRDQLPALRGGDPVGRACGGQTLVSIRDTGQFMDPRSENDWWQGHP